MVWEQPDYDTAYMKGMESILSLHFLVPYSMEYVPRTFYSSIVALLLAMTWVCIPVLFCRVCVPIRFYQLP